jgi:hypothetical protein
MATISKDKVVPKDSVTSSKSSTHLVVGNTKIPYTQSPLELLPTELVHEIFFNCLEINLPRASLVLGRVLADRKLYKALLRGYLQGYAPERQWGEEEPEITTSMAKQMKELSADFISAEYPGERILPHTNYLYESHDELDFANNQYLRIIMANKLLNCRWATESLVSECRNDFFNYVYNLWFEGYTVEVTFRNPTSTFYEFMPYNVELEGIDNSGGSREMFIHYWENTIHLILPDASSSTYPLDCRFPDTLLRGCPCGFDQHVWPDWGEVWTDEQYEYLNEAIQDFSSEDYRSHAIFCNWPSNTHWVDEAIDQQDLRLIHIMSQYTDQDGPCSFYRPHHLIDAVKTEVKDVILFVCRLKFLKHGKCFIEEFEGPRIREWAAKAENEGDAFCQWVLRITEEKVMSGEVEFAPEDMMGVEEWSRTFYDQVQKDLEDDGYEGSRWYIRFRASL